MDLWTWRHGHVHVMLLYITGADSRGPCTRLHVRAHRHRPPPRLQRYTSSDCSTYPLYKMLFLTVVADVLDVSELPAADDDPHTGVRQRRGVAKLSSLSSSRGVLETLVVAGAFEAGGGVGSASRLSRSALSCSTRPLKSCSCSSSLKPPRQDEGAGGFGGVADGGGSGAGFGRAAAVLYI